MKSTLTLNSFILSDDKQTLAFAILAYEKEISINLLTQLFNHSPYKNFKLNKSSLKNAVEQVAILYKNNDVDASNHIDSSKSGQTLTKSITIARRQDAELNIEIDDAKLNAKAILTSAYAGNPISANDLIIKIKELGIKKGINKKIIKLLLTKSQSAIPGSSFSATIAKGTPPVHSTNAVLKRCVETAKERILKPANTDHGKVDMRDLGQMLSVSSGDLLMKKEPIKEGTNGITVTGIVIPFNKGKDVTLKAGSNTIINEKDKNELLATLSGIPKVISDGMSVDEVLFVNSVEPTSGHVDYVGSIIIAGDVSEGMKVKATGDISIAGFVQSAQIECGGDLFVEKGIIGQKCHDDDSDLSCSVACKGSVIANFSQYSKIECGEDLKIKTQLLHCDVDCVGDIEVQNETGSKGTIFGGHLSAKGSVYTAILGTSAGGKTEIKIEGAYIELMNNKDSMTHSLNINQKKLKKLFDAQHKINLLPESEKKQMLDFRLMETKENIKSEISNLDDALNQNKYDLQNCEIKNEVIVSKEFHQGVTISISDQTYRSNQSYGATEVSIKEGKLNRLPYKK